MFEKVNQIAEQAAANVSRRRFFGQFGRGALTVAAALGGLLASTGNISAGRGTGRGHPPGSSRNCLYVCPDGSIFGVTQNGHCKPEIDGCTLG